MQHYITQLLDDIKHATKNASFPFVENPTSLYDFVTDEEEDANASVRILSEWTGVDSDMLPPATMLTAETIHVLLEELTKMLDVYNCHFVLQTNVPEIFQYETIRQNMNQTVKVKQWNMGFFAMCKPGTKHEACALSEYCQCAFYKEIFKDMIDEDLSAEQDRKRQLEIEVNHIKKKYGDEWIKYYPYHLDENYDDGNGNPYNYGFDDLDEDDHWWRR